MSFALEAPEGAALDFLVVFVVVLLGPAIMDKARIPGIIGFIVGGFAIGPHGLGLIGDGNQTVPELGQLGLLYLMFVAGLELDLGMLRLHRTTAVGFGVLTFSAPFAGGVAAGAVLEFSLPASLLLGSLLASHTLIMYPMIRDAGLGSNRAVASAVGATVLTDTLALVVLAGVSGSETGSGSTAEIYGELVVGLVVVIAGSLLGLPVLARLVFERVRSDRSVRFLVAMTSFLLMACVAEVFGIEGIVGAFFAGLAMNSMVPNEGRTMDRLEFFGSTVFIPVFLVSTGMLLDPAVMVEPETLGYAALLIVACLGGKGLATVLSIPLFHVSRPEAGVMFVLTTPQAAATLAATVVGFEIGLFSTVVVNAVLVLILVSIVVSSLLAPRFTRAVEDTEERHAIGERVLVAMAEPPSDRAALVLASRTARGSGGVVDWLLVQPPARGPVDRSGLESVTALAEREGTDGEVHLVLDARRAHVVVHTAAARGATLVIVDRTVALDGAQGGLGHWAEAMATAGPTPVVILAGAAPAIERVLVVDPDDGTGDAGERRFVEELARAVDGKPVVVSSPTWLDGLKSGDLAFVVVASWDEAEGLQEPPAGAVVAAVPRPTITGHVVPAPTPGATTT